MKEKLLIIIFLIITVISNGQIIDRINFNYGITSSDLSWEIEQTDSFPTYVDLDNRKIIGFYSGIDFDYLESKFLTLQTGIGFYHKGAKYDWANRAFEVDLHYLTFDTKVKVKYEFNNLIPYLIIGPRIDYLLKYGGDEFIEFDRLEMVNKFNYGLRYGFGVQYSFNKFILGFAWKNNASFNSTVENNGEYMRPAFDINDKTMIFNLDFGIKL